MTTTAGRPVERIDAALAAVSGDRLTRTVEELAADRFTGRRVGTPGGAAARAWLADQLNALGADVSTVSFPAPAVPEIYRAPTVQWHDGTRRAGLAFGRDVTLHLASADQPEIRRGGLAVAGFGDPAGRWLVVPPSMAVAEASTGAGGALGLLVGRAVDGHGWHYTILAGPDPGPLPVLTVGQDLHRRLLDLARTPGDGWWAADTPIRRVDATGMNLHARLAAPGPGGLDVLLTAHYDGVGDHPGLRQPAAADNASGVAVVVEAARVLAGHLPAGVGLSVALLDGEEVGAVGSAHHAKAMARQAGVVVVNVDGAGCLHEAAAVEAGGPAHGLLAALDQAAHHTGLPLRAGPVASDNRRYAAAGLPAVGVGAGMAGYHSPADTTDRVEPATMTALARLVIATVRLTAACDPARIVSR